MVRLHFHGHACWEITHGKHRILIDPFLSDNPLADVGPDAFDQLDAILLTHGHGDHIGDAVQIAKKTRLGACLRSKQQDAQREGARGRP